MINKRTANALAAAPEGPQTRASVLIDRSTQWSCLTVIASMRTLTSQWDKGDDWTDYDDGVTIRKGFAVVPVAAIELNPRLQYFLNRRLSEERGAKGPFPNVTMDLRESVKKDHLVVTIAQENCPWIICLGSHVVDGNITVELHMDRIDEFSSRRLDWLVVGSKSPQIQLSVNVRNKPDHCLLLVHKDFISDPTDYILRNDLPYDKVESQKGRKHEGGEILIEVCD